MRPNIEVPCGRCIGCRLEKARDWAVRCVHESQMHSENSYITLTYDEEHVPQEVGYDDYQLFMKRLRKEIAPIKIRFYMCAEYGEESQRPHYHALIFGYGFPDKYPWINRSGYQTYRSNLLERVWTKGSSEIGTVTPNSAEYVARYSLKKQQHTENTRTKAPKLANAIIDTETGEIRPRRSEFTRMSLKPGLGHSWFMRYWRDVFPEDRVVLKGKTKPAPAYYRELLQRIDPDLASTLKDRRILKAKENPDNTQERLDVKERVLEINTNRKKRNQQ